MDEQGAGAIMHNAVDFATWSESKAQRFDPLVRELQTTGRCLTNAEALELIDAFRELLRRGYNQPVLVAVLLLAQHLPPEAVGSRTHADLVERLVKAHLALVLPPPPAPWWRRAWGWLRRQVQRAERDRR